MPVDLSKLSFRKQVTLIGFFLKKIHEKKDESFSRAFQALPVDLNNTRLSGPQNSVASGQPPPLPSCAPSPATAQSAPNGDWARSLPDVNRVLLAPERIDLLHDLDLPRMSLSYCLSRKVYTSVCVSLMLPLLLICSS